MIIYKFDMIKMLSGYYAYMVLNKLNDINSEW